MSASRRSVVAAVSVATAGVLPSFLVGALAVQIRQDLDFSASALGLGPGVFFAVGAITSTFAGRRVERIGPRAGMRLAAVLAAFSSGGIALVARSWTEVLAFLAIAGAGNAFAQPGTNLLLARQIDPRHQATAFAVKQSAIPAATLLGGLAVPAIALTVGWRWAFGLAGGLALATLALVPDTPAAARSTSTDPSPRPRDPRVLAGLAAGAGFGAATAATLATFLVASAVDNGVGEAQAGLLFALGSVVGLASRLANGIVADRRGDQHAFGRVSLMMIGGAAGYALLVPGSAPLLVPATVIAYGLGWGWPGLFNFSVVATHREAPGAATGITQTGVYLGAVTGPLVFGFVVEEVGFATAWLTSTAASVAAGVVVALASTRLRRRERVETA